MISIGYLGWGGVRLAIGSGNTSGDRGIAREDIMWYNAVMTREKVKEILDRVLSWAPADQEKLARIVREIEQRRAGDEITDEEWKIIEERAVRRDLATDEEVEQVFSRYRSA
jgi:hypothetical protein